MYPAHALCQFHPLKWAGYIESLYFIQFAIYNARVSLSLFCRLAPGNATTGTGVPFSRKVSTCRRCCHRRATWTIPSTPSRRASSKRPPTKCAARSSPWRGLRRAAVWWPVPAPASLPSGTGSPSTLRRSYRYGCVEFRLDSRSGVVVNLLFLPSFSPTGSRRVREDHGLVAQRQLDGDGRPQRLRQVLAVQHEQRQDVPGPQGADPWNQVLLRALLVLALLLLLPASSSPMRPLRSCQFLVPPYDPSSGHD